MVEPYVPPLAEPAFTDFVGAEQACVVAWENVKDARTPTDRRLALENFRDVQQEARQARAFCHQCVNAVKYENERMQDIENGTTEDQ